MSMELESAVQQRLVTRLKQLGWFVVKVNLCSIPGFPDLVCIRNGRVVFIEVKRQGQKPRPLQLVCHERMRKCGATVLVYDGSDFPNDLL